MNLSPKQLADLHRQAQTALLEGRLREAHAHCLRILEVDRRHADAWFLCGVIAGRNRQFEKAVQILGNACSLNPEEPEYRAELGKSLLGAGRDREALETAQQAYAAPAPGAATLHTLGTVFSHCGEHERAIECFARAIQELERRRPEGIASGGERPQSPAARLAELHFNLAVSLQFAGRIEAAERAFEQAIGLRPDYFKAHSALATLRRQTPETHHLGRLEALRPKARTAADRLHLGHALAREQEDLGRYAEAMSSLRWAKREQAACVGYDFEAQKRLFERLRAVFKGELFEQSGPRGFPSPEPIFIVGMPRSGTTLVEQILGSHSRVFAAGELRQFPQIVARMTGASEPGSAADHPELARIEVSSRLDMAALGAAYLEATRPRTGHTPHFIDKLPGNFLYLGLIHLALPGARLICLRRDPMDTCLSNYRQLFAINAPHYHYNLDLEDCGRYFIQFDLLMRHWREVMPNAIYELSYEALVQDPATEVARLLDYCGLPWEDQCLEFHRRDNAVATPSAVQVKQGIYDTSIGRWRRYGDAVQPLYDMLAAAGLYDG